MLLCLFSEPLPTSYSLVIGSPADQYMCKRKPWTEADLSDGLLKSPESAWNALSTGLLAGYVPSSCSF